MLTSTKVQLLLQMGLAWLAGDGLFADPREYEAGDAGGLEAPHLRADSLRSSSECASLSKGFVPDGHHRRGESRNAMAFLTKASRIRDCKDLGC